MAASLFKFERPPEAPTFRPTPDEFQDPLGYINKIRPVAESYGICKIKPPQGWSPPFSLNPDKFTFVPRIQKINELEARTRLKLNFLDGISRFWDLQGVVFRIPSFRQGAGVPDKPLDLYNFYQLVTSKEVKNWKYVEKKKWSMVARYLGLPSSGRTSEGPSLQLFYLKYIQPFISFKQGEKAVVAEQHPQEPSKDKQKMMVIKVKCQTCGIEKELVQNLNKVPEMEYPAKWNCGGCLPSKMAEMCGAFATEFGFQDSDKPYSLREFGEMAEQFKRAHFQVPDGKRVSSEVCEEEYWRLAGQASCEVQVEYGADLSVQEVGSGFPRGDDDYYGGHPWNLNNLPKGKGSVFRWIQDEISGMKVPWIYVGMCFSTFCWHNEDHWTYSVSYLHWGEVKTWYGVSGGKAKEFEGVVKGLSGDLWGEKGDLLDGLVTSVNPNELMDRGVEVWRVDQGQGEFVVTFPRAYHQGFNQGLNVAEAVNFAGTEWLGKGRDAVEEYRVRGKGAVFCHDELVVRMASEGASGEEMGVGMMLDVWRDFGKMLEEEREGRRGMNGVKWEGGGVEECGGCKGMIWVSGVAGDGGEWRCLKCWGEGREGMEGGGIFKERLSVEELEEIKEGLGGKLKKYFGWKENMKWKGKGIFELRDMVMEARKSDYPDEEGLRRKGEEMWERAEKVEVMLERLFGRDLCRELAGKERRKGNKMFGCTLDVLEDLVGEMKGIQGVHWRERWELERRLERVRKVRERVRSLLGGGGDGNWREKVENVLEEAGKEDVGFVEIFQLQKKLEKRMFNGIFGREEEEEMEVVVEVEEDEMEIAFEGGSSEA